jgi:redox-sensitive bicupin YhaK (pirin superfamily)
MTITLRPAGERFHTQAGWLDSRHTFSFGEHMDRRHMGFRALRVINDDRILGGSGFPMHGHRDMEIVSYVVEGALAHEDSMGHASTIRPGDVQRMTAGTGVMHSEFNGEKAKATRFLQIWIIPERRGLAPGYEEKQYPESERQGRLRLVASRDARDGSATIHQDASVYAALLAPGDSVDHAIAKGRGVWVQIVRGAVNVNGTAMEEGDGAALENETKVAIEATAPTELLLFDLG